MTEPRPCLPIHPDPAEHRVRCRLCWLYLHDDEHARRWGNPDPATPGPEFLGRKAGPPQPADPGWGDRLAAGLKAVGVTPERVSKLLGKPCGCAGRQDQLNRLGRWVGRVLSRKAR